MGRDMKKTLCERCGEYWTSAHGVIDCLKAYDRKNGKNMLDVYKKRLLGLDENGNKLPPLNIFTKPDANPDQKDK